MSSFACFRSYSSRYFGGLTDLNSNPQSFSIFSAFDVMRGAASIPLTFVIPFDSLTRSTYLLSCVTAESSAVYLLHSTMVSVPFLS